MIFRGSEDTVRRDVPVKALVSLCYGIRVNHH